MNKIYPYQILGTADDGNIYFIDQNDRLQSWQPISVSKKHLGVLASLYFWKEDHPKKDGVDWDAAIDEVVTLSGKVDFDPDNVKGRGAWRDSDGNICYFDGKKVTGSTSSNWTFTRKTKKEIGLSEKHTPAEIRKEIYNVNKRLLYSNKEEAAKLLAWATLAPFGGALFWRPACFLTGASNSGKTAIVDLITKPLLGKNPTIFSGGGSTEAGVRQKIMNDASPVVLEETEDDTQKKKDNKEALLSLMRQSTSDDTPLMVKGTSDHKGAGFALRCMFMFVGISPEVSNEADDNRLFRVNMKSPPKGGDKDWPKKRDRLKELLTPENTDGIRAFTFDNLHNIITVAEKIQPMIQDATKENSRFAVSESLLVACTIIVYFDEQDIENLEVLKGWVEAFYKDHKSVERVNDVENILVRILDQKIKIFDDEIRGDYTPREILLTIRKGKELDYNAADKPYTKELSTIKAGALRRIMANNGLAIYNGKNEAARGQVAFAKNHPEIHKMLNGGSYYTYLGRHDDFISEEKICMAGKTRDCAIIGGLLEDN